VGLSSGLVRTQLSDEGGRIDIGKAPVEVLASLFRASGAPGGVADRLAQEVDAWRKPQDEKPGSAASRLSATPPTAKDDQSFSDVRQLLNVPGMAPEWVAAMLPLMTVFGTETVNPLTASIPVLAALPGIGQAQIEALLAARRGSPADAARLTASIGTAQKYLQVKTQQAASVDLVARLRDGYTTGARAVILLLPQDRQPYRVLAWTPLPSGDGS
jgi:general secretion pathway protein K